MKREVFCFLLLLLTATMFFSGCGGCNKKRTPVSSEEITLTPPADLTEKMPTKQPELSENAMVTGRVEPTVAPEVTKTPGVTSKPETEVTKGGEIPTVTVTPEPEVVEITRIPAPTMTQHPKEKITPTEKPKTTSVPEATKMPVNTENPLPTATPAPQYLSWERLAALVTEALELHVEGKSDLELLSLAGLLNKERMKQRKLPEKLDAYLILYQLALKNGEAPDSLLEETVKQEKRLTDLSGYSREETEAVYFLYTKGIAEGSSDGLYSGTRSMNGRDRITEEEFLGYINRLIGRKERRSLTKDGQLIRTVNLPEFAEYYSYILEDYPNAFYEWEFQFMKSVGDYVPVYVAPKELEDSEKRLRGFSYGEILKSFGKDYTEFVKDYLFHTFNVDYRRTPGDRDWYGYMYENNAGTVSFAGMNGPEYLKFRINQYLSDIQDNHTVLECDFVATDPSTVYTSGGEWYVRCYMHYRIVSADSTELVDFYRGQVEFSETFVGDYQNVIPGEWRDGYLDVIIRPEPDVGKVTVREVYLSDYAYFTRVKKRK